MAVTRLYTVSLTEDLREYLMDLVKLQPTNDFDADDVFDVLDRAQVSATFITPED